MEETLTAPKAKPTFGREPKKEEFVIDPSRRYRFQLIQTYEKMKPRDSKTGLPVDSLYPPLKMVPSEGIAFHKGNMRRWRYLYGYPTIWVDEQTKPEPTAQNLRDERNDILFREGVLFVSGSNKSLMHALMVQDEFEGNENSVSNVPKTFRLINEADALNIAATAADKAFEAETAARNASLEELMPLALLFGVNNMDIFEADQKEEYVRKQLILKARQLPDAFLKAFVEPRTKVKYIVTKALTQNIISGATGHIVLTETGKVFFDVDVNKDIAEQVAARVMANDQEAGLLYTQLQKVLA